VKRPYRLVAGQRLQVPVHQEHVVQPGDTLLALSRIYGVDQSSLARVNGLRPPYALKPGQRLTLPGRIDANLAAVPQQQESYVAPAASNAAPAGSMSIEELPAPTGQQASKQQTAAQPAAPSTADVTAPAAPQEPAPK